MSNEHPKDRHINLIDLEKLECVLAKYKNRRTPELDILTLKL